MRIRAFLLTVMAVLGLATLSAPQASAGEVSRTFSAYDLTQCNCVYTPVSNAYAYVKSAPLVTATSYYDSVFLYNGSHTYQRSTALDQFVLVGYYDSNAVLANAVTDDRYQALSVLCWTDDRYGNQMDKVTAVAYVNSSTPRRYIFYALDSDIRDGVRYANHHC